MTDTDRFWLRAITTRLEQSGDASEAVQSLRWLLETDAGTRMDVPEMMPTEALPYVVGE